MAQDNVGITEKFIEKSYPANDDLNIKNLYQRIEGIYTSFSQRKDKNLDQKRLQFTVFLYTARPGAIDISKLYGIAHVALCAFGLERATPCRSLLPRGMAMKMKAHITVKLPANFTEETILHGLRKQCLSRKADNQLYRRFVFTGGTVRIVFGDLRGYEQSRDIKSDCILFRKVLHDCFSCDFESLGHSIDYSIRDRIIFEITLNGEAKQ